MRPMTAVCEPCSSDGGEVTSELEDEVCNVP
jgi:hypothetical protein